jgi:YHS domain-containing protein
MSAKCFRFSIALLFGFALFAVAVAAATQPPINVSRGQLALRGYDAVSYSSDGKAVPGVPAFEYRWMNVVWRFASADHLERFKKEPERYAPEFGGYCAYAVSQGYTADGDPTVWRVVDGHLYLNYSTDAQKLWEKDVPGNITKGHQNWPTVLTK